MTDAIRLRRALGATLILTAIITTFPDAAASAMRTENRSAERNPHALSVSKICPIAWQRGRRFVKELIGCAARHFGVSADEALTIAYRESKFHARAYNSRTCAKGIFQHLCRYWPIRADDYGFSGCSAFNARANVFVTMRMVQRYGWWPWGE